MGDKVLALWQSNWGDTRAKTCGVPSYRREAGMSVLRMAMALFIALSLFSALPGGPAAAAPYAAIVIDARDGKVLHSRKADKRLHPASLTKMMTLYMAFEAVRDGRLRLDQKVRVSKHAAYQVPSKIGLKPGRRYTIRDLIRATAVKSANDAAVALAEAMAKSEADFAKAMTLRARRLGMKNTTFRNASGLTHSKQRSTARDMALLGRALFYDFPEYYNLFGRKKTRAAGKTILATNRRHLQSYRGADGIKTGYTRAAGYNLVSSAKRGSKRVIAVVFGGKSSRSRNARIAQLLDLGFSRAPKHVKVVKPSRAAVRVSPPPVLRPGRTAPAVEPTPSLMARAGAGVADALVPAAHAAPHPLAGTKHAPAKSRAPYLRPGRETPVLLAAPQLRPGRNIPAAREKPKKTAWAVQLGVFAKEETAIAELASAALSNINGLDTAGREISATRLSNTGKDAFRAQLTGFDEAAALRACEAIKARGGDCLPIGPDSTF